jgi:hypothetical protein
MLKELMHALTGNSAQNAAQGVLTTSSGISHQGMFGQVQARQTRSKKIFSGNIEVNQVANGFVINIATREGYEYETHIAHTITEVNEIIAAAMVAFQLEK